MRARPSSSCSNKPVAPGARPSIARSRRSTARPRKACAHRCAVWILRRVCRRDLAFIETERLTPLFVLVDRGREIGRIRGYPGEDHFWGQLGVLMKKLDASATGEERAQLFEITSRAEN